MKLRDFFKLTIWKIILMLIIPFYLVYNIQISMTISGPPAWWGFYIDFVPLIISIPWIIYNHFFTIQATPLNSTQSNLNFLLAIIIPLIINYLIACLIIFVYNKIRKKR